MSNEFPVIITTILIFTLGMYQTISAEKDGGIKHNFIQIQQQKNTLISLPFNIHIANQAKDKNTYSSDNLPFP